MNKFLQKYVDNGLYNETVGNYIQEALDKKESIIIAGHRSTGIRPLFATIAGAANVDHDTAQVKSPENLEKETEYFLIPGNENIDFGELIYAAIDVPNTALITVKEPEVPFSLMKVLRDYTKEHGVTDKVFHSIDLKKNGEGSDAVPYTDRVTKFYVDEKGKVKKEKLNF